MASISGNMIFICIDNEEIAGQKGASINYSTTDVDVTVKRNAGWTNAEAETNEWTVDCDGLVDLTDNGYAKLKKAWREKKKVEVKYGTEDRYEKGMAIVSSIQESAPLNDRCTWSASFKGCGQLEEVVEMSEDDDENEGDIQDEVGTEDM